MEVRLRQGRLFSISGRSLDASGSGIGSIQLLLTPRSDLDAGALLNPLTRLQVQIGIAVQPAGYLNRQEIGSTVVGVPDGHPDQSRLGKPGCTRIASTVQRAFASGTARIASTQAAMK